VSDAPFRSVATALAIFATVAGTAQTPLRKDSPFIPQGAATAMVAANETLEFAGVSSIGKKTDLIIYDKTVKKSRWIGIGETVEGITVLNYDSRLEQAVLRVNGGQKILTLRKGAGPLNTPAPVAPMPSGFATPSAPLPAPAFVQQIPPPPPPSSPVAPDAASRPAAPATPAFKPPATPEIQAKQEVEARMLVSDLLEIGMAQRKAYEEAQKKASDPAPAPPPAQPVPPSGGG
jgi:hypothetical protein